jgi:hypothetical protein
MSPFAIPGGGSRSESRRVVLPKLSTSSATDASSAVEPSSVTSISGKSKRGPEEWMSGAEAFTPRLNLNELSLPEGFGLVEPLREIFKKKH